MGFHRIDLTINGELEQVDIPANMTLMDMLREVLVLTGTKNGCAAGECGACTVMMNGEPVNSCLVLAVECDWPMTAGSIRSRMRLSLQVVSNAATAPQAS
jgi:carbon-monoxide dehydrogenase small subunit